MASTRCPDCGLVNPASAQQCDCGRNFGDGSRAEKPYLARREDDPSHGERQARTIGLAMAIGGLVLGLVTIPAAAVSTQAAIVCATLGSIVGVVGRLIVRLTRRAR